MAKPIFRLMAACCLGVCLAAVASESTAPSDPWASALSMMQAEDYPGAEKALASFVESTSAQGIGSPQAHFNLGLTLWHQKRHGMAVYHFLKSTSLRSSPVRAWQTLDTLREIERELGIREGMSERPSLRFSFLVGKNALLWSFSIGFWGLCAAWLMWWSQGNRAFRAARQLAVLPAFLLFISSIALLYRAFAPPVGVLVEDKASSAQVFRVPDGAEDNKLIELPAGTIVTWGREEKGFIEIAEPVTGWVAATSFRSVEY